MDGWIVAGVIRVLLKIETKSYCDLLVTFELVTSYYCHVDIGQDPRTCTPGTPGVCHPDATCTPVTPYVCSSTRPMSYRCECNQGYSGDGLTCTGELELATVTVQTKIAFILTSRSYLHQVYCVAKVFCT